jgi:hypothetical protein
MLNFSFLLITFVTKSTWNVSSSGNEKVTVVLKFTAIFLFAHPRPEARGFITVLLSSNYLQLRAVYRYFLGRFASR